MTDIDSLRARQLDRCEALASKWIAQWSGRRIEFAMAERWICELWDAEGRVAIAGGQTMIDALANALQGVM